jgi:hypothetical protein
MAAGVRAEAAHAFACAIRRVGVACDGMSFPLQTEAVRDALRVRTWSPVRRFLAGLCTAFTLSFAGGAMLFLGLRWFLRLAAGADGSPVAYLYRMAAYPDAHPLQYVAVVALPFSFLTALWAVAGSGRLRVPRWLQITGLIALSLAAGCALGGVLYEFHDMQAGYFPARDIMFDHFRRGAWWGLGLGPLIIALSVPMNVAAFLVAYAVASLTRRTFGR